MKETYEFLKKAKVFYLATAIDGQPNCRPFGAQNIYENKIYFITNKQKNVSRELNVNNNVCIVAFDNENWLRINCQLVDDSHNSSAKASFLESNPELLNYGYSLENENMQILYLNQVKATIADAAGNIKSTYEF